MEQVQFDREHALTAIGTAISSQGYYFIDGLPLELLLGDASRGPAEKLVCLQNLAEANGWRVITRDQCRVAMFLRAI